MKEPSDRPASRAVRRITVVGLGVNLGLAAAKFAAGTLGRSQAVMADAFHSVSDIAGDLVILLGVQHWSAPPDEEHPYGHQRIETVVTCILGLLLAGMAVKLGIDAAGNIRRADDSPPSLLALWGPLLSIAAKEVLYQWTVAVGKQARSAAVLANAWHHRSDALSSVPALIAVGLSVWKPAWRLVDPIGAIIIAVFILKVAWDVIRPALSELIDRGASDKERRRIVAIAEEVDGVRQVHAVRTRQHGPALFADLHLLVNPDLTVRQGHDIAEQVKQALVGSGADVVDVVVHTEPDDHAEHSPVGGRT